MLHLIDISIISVTMDILYILQIHTYIHISKIDPQKRISRMKELKHCLAVNIAVCVT